MCLVWCLLACLLVVGSNRALHEQPFKFCIKDKFCKFMYLRSHEAVVNIIFFKAKENLYSFLH